MLAIPERKNNVESVAASKNIQIAIDKKNNMIPVNILINIYIHGKKNVSVLFLVCFGEPLSI